MATNEVILKLDYDFTDAIKLRRLFRDNRYIFKKLGLKVSKLKVFNTLNGYHVYIILKNKDLNDYDILILQILLGSDKQREIFNFQRLRSKIFKDKWNVLFSLKIAYKGSNIGYEKFNFSLTKIITTIIKLQ